MLFVARPEVLERFLIGMFADDIREDLDLRRLRSIMQPPRPRNAIASPRPAIPHLLIARVTTTGYELTDMVRNYRTLTQTGSGPVAAAPDPTLSL